MCIIHFFNISVEQKVDSTFSAIIKWLSAFWVSLVNKAGKYSFLAVFLWVKPWPNASFSYIKNLVCLISEDVSSSSGVVLIYFYNRAITIPIIAHIHHRVYMYVGRMNTFMPWQANTMSFIWNVLLERISLKICFRCFAVRGSLLIFNKTALFIQRDIAAAVVKLMEESR